MGDCFCDGEEVFKSICKECKDNELKSNFIVETKKEAYSQWLDDLIPTIKDYIKEGIQVHVCKEEVIDVTCKSRKLTMDEKIRIALVADKFLLCLKEINDASLVNSVPEEKK